MINLPKVTKIKLIFFVSILLLSSGCKIDFQGKSQVNEDGSIVRETSYHADSIDMKKSILDFYVLPTNGNWKEQKSVVEGKEVVEYEFYAKQIFKKSAQPATDYKQFNESHTRFASNLFRVKTVNLWFLKWFDYQEDYKDIRDKQIAGKFFKDTLNIFMNVFRENWKDKSSADVSRELKTYYEGISNQLLTYSPSKTDDKKLESDITIEEAEKYLLLKFPELNEKSKEQKLKQALLAGQNAVEKFWNQLPDQKLIQDSVSGINGFVDFDNHNFQVRVVLPGTTVFNNAPKREKNVLMWSFGNTGLNHHFFANSVRVYPIRLGIVLIILILMIFVWKRKSKWH